LDKGFSACLEQLEKETLRAAPHGQNLRHPRSLTGALSIPDLKPTFPAADARDQHTRLDKHVLQSDIAMRVVANLTETALASWRKSLASNLGAATRKRITTDFKAVLNSFAKMHRMDLPADMLTIVKNGLASNERVESGARTEQILSDSDIRRLVATAWEVDKAGGWEGDLARLVSVLAATGARFSQVIRMTVADVQESRLMIPPQTRAKAKRA
jgi:integrase